MQIGSDKLLVNIDAYLQDGLTTEELEALIDKIKKRIREKVSSIDMCKWNLKRRSRSARALIVVRVDATNNVYNEHDEDPRQKIPAIARSRCRSREAASSS